MIPVSQSFGHTSVPLPQGQVKHETTLLLHCSSVTPSAEHDFSLQEREILRQLYSPLLQRLTVALSTFGGDPAKSLDMLKNIKIELATALQQ